MRTTPSLKIFSTVVFPINIFFNFEHYPIYLESKFPNTFPKLKVFLFYFKVGTRGIELQVVRWKGV